MTEKQMYPALNRELGAQRSALARKPDAAFRAFSAAVFPRVRFRRRSSN